MKIAWKKGKKRKPDNDKREGNTMTKCRWEHWEDDSGLIEKKKRERSILRADAAINVRWRYSC